MIVQANSLDAFPIVDRSVQTIVTSPPYWGLRSYGIEPSVIGGVRACAHEWEHHRYYVEGGGGAGSSAEAFSEPGPANAERIKQARWREDDTCQKCGAWRGCLGLEPTPEMFVAHIVMVFREAWRVLRGDGTLWLNLGDTYASTAKGNGGHGHKQDSNTGSWFDGRRVNGVPPGLKQKDLVGIPWRVALALQADGWWLRSDIVWSKPNPMPESVTDRPTKSHEYLFLFAKQGRYYYNAEAIREASVGANEHDLTGPGYMPPGRAPQKGNRRSKMPDGWDSKPGAHGNFHREGREHGAPSEIREGRNKRTVWTVPTEGYSGAHFATYPPALIEPCILAGSRPGDVVLDPFCGSGTTGAVARLHGRRFVGMDLNGQYLRDYALPRAEGGQTAESMAALPLFGGIGGGESVNKQEPERQARLHRERGRG